MCVPSIAPTHWGKPHLQLNPSTTSWRQSPVGTLIYSGSNNSTIATHTSLTATNTVDSPTPNRFPIDLYSALMPSLHNVTATRSSTESGSLTQWRFWRRGASLEHKYTKVTWLNRKLSLKLSALQQHTILSKKSLLLHDKALLSRWWDAVKSRRLDVQIIHFRHRLWIIILSFSSKEQRYWMFHSLCWRMRRCLARSSRKTIKTGSKMSGTAIASTYT